MTETTTIPGADTAAAADAGDDGAFPCWAILELMGHRRLAGKISEAELFGGALLRIDIPGDSGDSGPPATQFYGASAIYCITPTSEEMAKKVAALARPAPVSRWELEPPFPPAPTAADDEHEDAGSEAAWS